MTDRNAWREMRIRLESVKPSQISVYLTETGWHRSDAYGRGQLWRLGAGNDSYEVYQPNDVRLTDYVTRIADLLETIAIVENRTTTDVLADLKESGSDTQYYSLKPLTPSGTIPLTSLAEALDGIRKLNTAVAYSELVSETQIVQPSSKPHKVHDFVRGALVGPSRAGSYVLSVRSAEESQGEEDGLFDVGQLSRRVSHRLDRSVAAAQLLAQTQHMRVESAMEKRLSANLLEALATIGGTHEPIGFSVRVGSSIAETAVGRRRTVEFEPSDLEMLQGWAGVIRDHERSRKIIVEGRVIAIRPGAEQRLGSATLHGEARGIQNRGFRHYEVELPDNLLNYAIQARQNQTYVTVEGLLADTDDAQFIVGVGKFTLHDS